MTITLIVPIYNEEPFLERCLRSIEKQTVKFDEVIMIDDRSTDNSVWVATQYAFRNDWRLIVNKRNMGLSYTRNVGIKKAKSEYVTFLDSDDELTLDACEIMHKAIEQYPKENFFQFNHLRHYARINKTVKKYDNRAGRFDVKNLHDCACWWGAWNKLMRKFAITKLLREELGKYGEDGVWILELVLDGAKIRTIDRETIIHHFENPNSLTKSKGKRQIELLDKAQREILAKHCGVDEPIENILAIIESIKICQENPIYKAIRESNDE